MDYQDPHLEEPGPAALGYPTKTLHGRQKRFFTERVACRPLQRERLCRCVTRPTVCLERLSTNATGQVSYELKHPLRDGTTHILFTPDDFLARLAALVPRPRSNLIRYFYRIGGALRPTHHSGGQWSLVQQNRRATNQRNRQYRPPLNPLSIKHSIARH